MSKGILRRRNGREKGNEEEIRVELATTKAIFIACLCKSSFIIDGF